MPSRQNTAEKPLYWSEGEPRWFVSGRSLLGLGYGRAALDTGYGKPHFVWTGFEVLGCISPQFGSLQAGLVASALIANLAIHYRTTHSFSHHRVDRADHVSSADLEGSARPLAAYSGIDASLWGFVPYRRFLLLWEVTWVRPTSLSQQELVLEEIQRVVIGRHGVFSTKLGSLFALSSTNNWYVGAFADQLTLLGRSNDFVLRFGPAMWAQLTDHLEIAVIVAAPVISPDDLDLLTGTYGTAALVYRFASQEPRSAFP
jgi:hypothetical protein